MQPMSWKPCVAPDCDDHDLAITPRAKDLGVSKYAVASRSPGGAR